MDLISILQLVIPLLKILKQGQLLNLTPSTLFVELNELNS